MITCEQITQEVHSCDNCNRIMPMCMKYTFSDKKPTGLSADFGQVILCEDCSTALSNLHFKVMTNGIAHKYDLDEITEVKSNGTK